MCPSRKQRQPWTSRGQLWENCVVVPKCDIAWRVRLSSLIKIPMLWCDIFGFAFFSRFMEYIWCFNDLLKLPYCELWCDIFGFHLQSYQGLWILCFNDFPYSMSTLSSSNKDTKDQLLFCICINLGPTMAIHGIFASWGQSIKGICVWYL